MSGKKVLGRIRLLIPTGAAKPAPPVGPALGQFGLNIMAFCKEFNAKTAGYKEGVLHRVRVVIYEDKTHSWELKQPPTSWLVKQAVGLARGADKPGHEDVGSISLKHLYEIAQIKQKDMPLVPLRSVIKCLMRSCQSIGVKVVARPEDAW